MIPRVTPEFLFDRFRFDFGTRFSGLGARTRKKKRVQRVRERVKYGWGTIPSLKKVLHAKKIWVRRVLKKSAARQKNTGSAGPAQNREKKTGERTGQIRVGYHTVLKKSAARQKKYGFGGSSTEP